MLKNIAAQNGRGKISIANEDLTFYIHGSTIELGLDSNLIRINYGKNGIPINLTNFNFQRFISSYKLDYDEVVCDKFLEDCVKYCYLKRSEKYKDLDRNDFRRSIRGYGGYYLDDKISQKYLNCSFPKLIELLQVNIFNFSNYP